MFDLSKVVASIAANAPSVAQAFIPDPKELPGVDADEALMSILDGQIGDRVYRQQLPPDPTYPLAAFFLTDSEPYDYDGYPLLRQYTFRVEVHGRTLATVSPIVQSMRTAIMAYSPAAACGTAEPLSQNDLLFDDQNLVGHGLDVRLTYLTRVNQALPAVFVYPIESAWEQGGAINCAEGVETFAFAVVWAAKIPAGGVTALSSLREEIRAAVCRTVPGGEYTIIEPAGASQHEIFSTIALWRDNYEAKRFIKYPQGV